MNLNPNQQYSYCKISPTVCNNNFCGNNKLISLKRYNSNKWHIQPTGWAIKMAQNLCTPVLSEWGENL